MRKAGFKLRFCPDIISYQHTRSSLPKMLKQKYGNGYWIGKTSKVCPGCLSVYHFVPWAFVMAIIVTAVASVSCKLLAVKSFFLVLYTDLQDLCGEHTGCWRWLCR